MYFLLLHRLRELHGRNNRFGTLLELAVYTRQMRRLVALDLRANPVCTVPGYREVVLTTYPVLLNLDSEQVDPVEHVRAEFYLTGAQLFNCKVRNCRSILNSMPLVLFVLNFHAKAKKPCGLVNARI